MGAPIYASQCPNVREVSVISWSKIDQKKLKAVVHDKQLMKHFESDRLIFISFVEKILENPNLEPQDDYKGNFSM